MECKLGMNEGQTSSSGLVWVSVGWKFQESSVSGVKSFKRLVPGDVREGVLEI